MTHAVWGHAAGLYGSYTFSRYLTLEAGVHYIEKGAKHDVNNATFPFGTMFLDYRYDYLEIPLILKTFWFNIRRFSLYSFGGLYGGFLVNTRYRFHNELWGDSESEIGDTQKKDWGFTSGAGIQFQHGRLEIGMEYRYSMGFQDISFPTLPVNIELLNQFPFPVIHLRNMCHAFCLRAGYAFLNHKDAK